MHGAVVLDAKSEVLLTSGVVFQGSDAFDPLPWPMR
jgi:hypothetical protein